MRDGSVDVPPHKTREHFEAEHQGRVPWPSPVDLQLPLSAEIFGYVHSSVSWENNDRRVTYGNDPRRGGFVATAPATMDVNVAFIGWVDGDLVTITAHYRGSDSDPPRGYWSDRSIERRPMDPSDEVIHEAMRRGRQIPKPRKAREPAIVPAEVRADEAAFNAAVAEIEKE